MKIKIAFFIYFIRYIPIYYFFIPIFCLISKKELDDPDVLQLSQI